MGAARRRRRGPQAAGGRGTPTRAALAERLATWLPGFQDALVVTDPTGFYAAAATALLAAVARERGL